MKTTKTTKTAAEEIPAELAEHIAKSVLGLDTIESRGRDSLDFNDIGVARLREALGAAYLAGQEAGSAPDASRLAYSMSLTHDEQIALDAMMLQQMEALRNMGAKDFADARGDLRMRVLRILDAYVRPEGR